MEGGLGTASPRMIRGGGVKPNKPSLEGERQVVNWEKGRELLPGWGCEPQNPQQQKPPKRRITKLGKKNLHHWKGTPR